jgi:hypothetical protein
MIGDSALYVAVCGECSTAHLVGQGHVCRPGSSLTGPHEETDMADPRGSNPPPDNLTVMLPIALRYFRTSKTWRAAVQLPTMHDLVIGQGRGTAVSALEPLFAVLGGGGPQITMALEALIDGDSFGVEPARVELPAAREPAKPVPHDPRMGVPRMGTE